MRLKIFSGEFNFELEDRFNDWFIKEQPKIFTIKMKIAGHSGFSYMFIFYEKDQDE